MEILWDEPKRLANVDKHGLDFASLTRSYFLTAAILPARGRRLKAIGRLAGQLVVVIFEPWGSEAISVISLRMANVAERRLLDERS